jgi:serine/threonine protein kinase
MALCSTKLKKNCSSPCIWKKNEGCRNICQRGKKINPKTGKCKKIDKKIRLIIKCPLNQIPIPDGKKCSDMELIDSGTYGCVMMPPVTEKKYIIKNDIQYEDRANDDISKLYKAGYKEYLKELQILNFIQKIDPSNKFTTKLKGAQHLSSNIFDDIDSNVNYCLRNKKQNIYYQIILENGGKKLTDEYQLSYNKFLELFKPFIKGIIKLHKNGIVHRDIKPANVLIKKTKISLIDFGLSCRSKDVFKEKYNHILSYHYTWYPPEFYIAYILLRGYSLQNSESILHIMKHEGYFTHSYMTLSLQNIYEEGISKFIEDVKQSGITNFDDIFTPELALKSDMFPIAHLISALNKNIIYKNSEQKSFIEYLYNRCIDCNPYTRISSEELYNIIINKSK